MRREDADEIGSSRVTLRNGTAASLRSLSQSDGEALADFYATVPDVDNFYYAPHPLTHEEAMKKAARADDPRFVCLVLEVDGHAIGGYASYQWDDDAARESVFGICVGPAYQDAGAGRTLMTRIKEVARDVGPRVMSLTVQKTNERAFALYSRMGFEVVREQLRVSDDEPEYYMELCVSRRNQT